MSYGILRYTPGSGLPENDAASFDGWYTDEVVASAVFDLWKRRFPTQIVALVKSIDTRFTPD